MLQIPVHIVIALPQDHGAFIEGVFLDEKAAQDHRKHLTTEESEVQYADSEIEVRSTYLMFPDELCLIMSNDYADGNDKPVPEAICLNEANVMKLIKAMLKNTNPEKGTVYEKEELGYKRVPVVL